MARKTVCTLSTANLLHNLNVIKATAPKSKVMAMVKANAFGHGIRSVSLRLEGHVDALGVASIDEALALRKVGVTTPITLIEGVFSADELRTAAEQKFPVVFHSDHQLKWLAQAKVAAPLYAWLKIDTGMGRLGFSLDKAREALKAMSESASIIQPVGVMSHFACADNPSHPMNAKQIAAFKDFIKDHSGTKSFCNSASLFAFPDMHFDWVRPGLALYGASPLAERSAESLGLLPVMTFKTELIAIQNFKRGDTVGYGADFICPEDMPVGIAAVGYGDGYPRRIRTGMPVLVNGKRCSLVGRVSMDMMAIDLRACPDADVGNLVTLWGEGLPVNDLEGYCDHVSYDLLTSVQNRVRFEWEDDIGGKKVLHPLVVGDICHELDLERVGC